MARPGLDPIEADFILQRAMTRVIERASRQDGHNDMMDLQPRPARSFSPLDSPFCTPMRTLLEPQELPASTTGEKIGAMIKCSFDVQSKKDLSTCETTFPRTEVQLRFFNTSGPKKKYPDEQPLNCIVRVNNEPLPEALLKSGRPLMITSNVMKETSNSMELSVNWTADIRQWAVAVYLVSRVNWEIVHRVILGCPLSELPHDHTETIIKNRLAVGEDDDVTVDSLKMSLICPMGRARMKIAARFRACTHLQCFDLETCIKSNEHCLTWKCSVCHRQSSFEGLVIDKYFTTLLGKVHASVTEVELCEDGSYRVIREDGTVCAADDDGAPAHQAAILRVDDDIEILKDSDFICIGNDEVGSEENKKEEEERKKKEQEERKKGMEERKKKREDKRRKEKEEEERKVKEEEERKRRDERKRLEMEEQEQQEKEEAERVKRHWANVRREEEEKNQKIEEARKKEKEEKRKEERRKRREEKEERRKKEFERRERKKEEKKKREEEERKEKERMNASMLDKECKICFEEISNGVVCMLCGSVIGCKGCMNGWLAKDNSCPHCRRPYTNVATQVVDLIRPVGSRKRKGGTADAPGQPTPKKPIGLVLLD